LYLIQKNSFESKAKKESINTQFIFSCLGYCGAWWPVLFTHQHCLPSWWWRV